MYLTDKEEEEGEIGEEGERADLQEDNIEQAIEPYKVTERDG